MTPTRQGSFRLFQLFGIDVYLHWSWFLLLVYSIQWGTHRYGSLAWNVLELLTLFLIVLMHEFGHALACRQVGGQANQIVLWPLGGVAYVAPPQRPGAMLWSIAAGPLVNVVLLPILTVPVLPWLLGRTPAWAEAMPNVYLFVRMIWAVNLSLLIFNMLPVYPLDGGQILRSLLWFVFGRARSLMIATSLGFVGIAGLLTLAILEQSKWLGILLIFMVLNCWSGWMRARALLKLARLPRRDGAACPRCKSAPPVGAIWVCGNCRQSFDTFETQAVCPRCGTHYATTACFECGEASPLAEWWAPGSAPPHR
jgi:Zn-dependent protease